MQYSDYCNAENYVASGDERSANLPQIISGLRIGQEDNDFWVKNISSTYIYDNPNTKQIFSNTENMQAKYREKIFGDLPALRFDGYNDFIVLIIIKIYLTKNIFLFYFKIIRYKHTIKGTLLSSNTTGGIFNERYFIEDGKLKYQYMQEGSKVILIKIMVMMQ